jgi:hypothetical protein
VSSIVEPLFLPLILFGLLALLYMLIRLAFWLNHVRRGFLPTTSMTAAEVRSRELGKLLSSLLLWLGLLLLDSLALLYIFVQGDDSRVLSGRLVAVMVLAGSGLIAVALWIRLRLHGHRTMGPADSHLGTR